MLRKSKTIQEIYNEVSGYDLVITNDAPLATALNKLVVKSRLGYLAMTPKQIAKKFAALYYEKIYDKNEIILSLFKNKNISLNLLHQTVKKIYEIWMYNAKFEFIPEFLSDEENKILKLLSGFDTIETVMENFNEDFYGNKKMAVIGEELFTLLDMEVLFKRGTPAIRIGLFKNEEYLIDKTYVFGSDESLTKNIVDLINEENADETAIVLNTDSEYLEIIKSLIAKKGLKVEEKNYLRDDLSVRTLISFLELSLDIDNIELKEIIPLANEFGIRIPSEFNNYNAGIYIKNVSKDNELKTLYKICSGIRKMKFIELIINLKENFDYEVNPVFIELLEISELDKAKISEKNLTDLKYIIKEFEIETESERTGILFVNAMNSAFIDRKLVFFIGLDDSWMRIYPDKDYLNKEEEEEKSRIRFQILIQQGEKKYYFVRNIKNYEDVIPCYYFPILSGEKSDSFEDKFFNPVFIQNENRENKFVGNAVKISAKPVRELHDISPTSLNNYFKCPKLYSFNKLFPYEVNPAMMRGTLFHDFAELYFNHPEFVDKKFNKVIDVMIDEMAYFVKSANIKFVRTDFRLGAESIIGFLEDLKVHKSKVTSPSGKSKNILMEKFGLKKIYNNTEKWIRGSGKSCINGKIDLLFDNKIVDYKSSAYKKSDPEVTLQSNLDYILRNEYANFDFQAIAYISFLRESFQEVEFIYNFLLTNFRNQLNHNVKEKNCLTNIRYFNQKFSEHIRNPDFVDELKSIDKPGRFLDAIGMENYHYILDNLGMEEYEYFEKESLENKFIEIANSVLAENDLNFKTFNCRKQESFIDSYIRPIAGKIYNERAGKNGYGTVFKDDCDNFIKFAEEKILEINEFNKSKFPFKPVFGLRETCKKCDYLNLCTGNKLWH